MLVFENLVKSADLFGLEIALTYSLLAERVNELESGTIPLLEKEGWMRDQENIAKQPYFAQTGWSVRRNSSGLKISPV